MSHFNVIGKTDLDPPDPLQQAFDRAWHDRNCQAALRSYGRDNKGSARPETPGLDEGIAPRIKL